MLDNDLHRTLDPVVRGIATAAKTLRLYPPTSPIPRQSVEAASAALRAFLNDEPVLPLVVARDGFTFRGQSLGGGAAGIADLADALRAHNVAEIDFTPGCGPDDLLTLLAAVAREPADLRGQGGVSAVLTSQGIECVRVTDVVLTVAEGQMEGPGPEQDVEAFLRDVASDPGKLETWLAQAVRGDAGMLAEGLTDLAAAAGPDGLGRLVENLAAAFVRQNPDGRDAVIGLALEPNPAQGLLAKAFGNVGDQDLASAVSGGLYGKNMLSLSSALKRLPIAERLGNVLADVKAMMPTLGHTDHEREFLEHMLEVRGFAEPEASLPSKDPSYAEVARAASLSSSDLTRMQAGVAEAARGTTRRGVSTMLTLLDQQSDFGLYCKNLEALAGMVPRLIEQGDLELAGKVLAELSSREGRTSQPWPELTDRLRAAIDAAAGPRSMAALLRATVGDRSLEPRAREVVKRAGEHAHAALVDEALRVRDGAGLEVAEALLGRRLIDILAALAPRAQWFQAAAVVRRLAVEPDPRSQQAVEALVARADEQSRRETASGLGHAGGAAATRHLGRLLADASAEVAMVAARGLARVGTAPAASTLADRLAGLDVDGRDFLLAREVIGALARIPDKTATDALRRVASRKALIKRGHFAEVQELARQALDLQAKGGGAA